MIHPAMCLSIFCGTQIPDFDGAERMKLGFRIRHRTAEEEKVQNGPRRESDERLDSETVTWDDAGEEGAARKWNLGVGSKNQPWTTAYQYLQWSMNQQKVSNERYNPSLVLINTFIIQPARNISDVAVDRHLLLLFTQVEVDSQDAAVLNLSGNWFH